MNRSLYATVVASVLAVSAPHHSFADPQDVNPPPATTSKPTPSKLTLKPIFANEGAAIITGIGGVVTATQQPLVTGYLSQNRSFMFRVAFQFALNTELQKTPKGAFKPFVGSDPSSLSSPSPSAVLCTPKGPYELLAAQETYLNAVSQTLTKLEAPVQSANIIEALATLASSSNAIKIPTAAPGAQQKVVTDCEADLNGNWTAFYYPQPAASLESGSALSFSPLGEITTLLNLATQLIDIFTDLERVQDIDNYLYTNQKIIIDAATSLVTAETTLVSNEKNNSIGQFVDKMAVLASLSIDLSKVDVCNAASSTPPATGQAALGKDGDAFAACAAQAWQQVSEQVQAAVAAAAQYDTFSDIGSTANNKNLATAVTKLKNDFGVLKDPRNFNLSNLFSDVSAIVSYAQQVQQALSPSKSASCTKTQ